VDAAAVVAVRHVQTAAVAVADRVAVVDA
jgi:hypothetical protein